jgi:hypothetical protein
MLKLKVNREPIVSYKLFVPPNILEDAVWTIFGIIYIYIRACPKDFNISFTGTSNNVIVCFVRINAFHANIDVNDNTLYILFWF